ncbi:hypothetical protein BsWGS_26164 [Bradybaena similaris]
MAEAHHSEDDILTCSICLEGFNEPKILPCLHRFCESCLSRHITESVSTTTAKQQGFSCPCCRSFTPAQNPTGPRSEWAAQFKTDFVIKELVSFRSRAPSEVKYSCPTHKEIVCEYYCVDCSRILCHRCALESHRRCNQVSTLTEAVNDRKIKLRHSIENIMEQLEQATNLENLDVEMKNIIEDKRGKVEAAITAWEKDVIRRVAREKEELLKQLNVKCEGLLTGVGSEMMKIGNIKNTLEGRLKTALSYLSLPDKDIILDNSVVDITRECKKSDLFKADELVNRIITNVHSLQITFRKINPVSKYLGSLEMADVLQDTAEVRENSILRATNDDLPTIQEITLNKPNKISVLRTIDISYEDNTIYVSGIIVVAPSNSIIVTECKNRLIMFASNGDKCGNMQLSDSPWSIAQVSDKLLVVSLPLAGKICFIRVHPLLKVLSYKKCKKYWGLATLDTTTLVAASQACIDIIDTNGQVLKSFTNMINSDIPKFVFSSAIVCVSPDKMIIAYFHDKKSLVCLSQDGKTKFKYSQPDVRGVACDSSGNIFLVSGNGLLTLTSDGKPSKTLISSTDDTLSNPTYVCLDNEGLVYVVNKKSKEIKVLSLVGLDPVI